MTQEIKPYNSSKYWLCDKEQDICRSAVNREHSYKVENVNEAQEKLAEDHYRCVLLCNNDHCNSTIEQMSRVFLISVAMKSLKINA